MMFWCLTVTKRRQSTVSTASPYANPVAGDQRPQCFKFNGCPPATPKTRTEQLRYLASRILCCNTDILFENSIKYWFQPQLSAPFLLPCADVRRVHLKPDQPERRLAFGGLDSWARLPAGNAVGLLASNKISHASRSSTTLAVSQVSFSLTTG